MFYTYSANMYKRKSLELQIAQLYPRLELTALVDLQSAGTGRGRLTTKELV